MRFFAYLFITRLKIILTPSFFFVILLFPLFVLAAGMIFGEADADGIHIGVLYLQEPVEDMAFVMQNFEAYAGENSKIILYPAHAQHEMENDVVRGRLECAYIIEPEKLTLVKSPLTMSDNVFNIILVSGLAETMSGELGYQVLKPYFPDRDKEGFVEDIQKKADEYASLGPFMEMKTIWVGDSALPDQTNAMRRPSHGLTALFVYLLSFLGALAFTAEKKSRMQYRIKASALTPAYYLMINHCVLFTVNLFFFIVSGIAAALSGFGLYNLASETIMTISFSAGAAALALGLAVLTGDDGVYAPLLVFMFLLTALFGGVIIPLQEVITPLKPLQYILLTGFYLDGLEKVFPMYEAAALVFLPAVFCTGCFLIRKNT